MQGGIPEGAIRRGDGPSDLQGGFFLRSGYRHSGVPGALSERPGKGQPDGGEPGVLPKSRVRPQYRLILQLRMDRVMQMIESERDIHQRAIDEEGRHAAHAAAFSRVHVFVHPLPVNLV